MGECRLCKKTGLVFAINSDGLCLQCAKQLELEREARIGAINTAIGKIQSSSELEIQLSCLDAVLKNARALQIYEDIGISITNPPLSQLIADGPHLHDMLIIGSIEDAYNEAVASFTSEPLTAEKKIAEISRIMAKAERIQGKLTRPEALESLIQRADTDIHDLQLNAYIGEAEWAEKIGAQKKAVDAYLEALNFLLTDNIDDSLQQEEINRLESKIDELTEG